MVGVAPEAKIYALKVFPSNDAFATGDSVLAAMDRAITLKKNFDAGEPSVPVSGSGTEDDPFVYESLNIQVVNMSLGGLTLAAGRDLAGLMTEEMLKAGIMLAAAAANAGPTALTVADVGAGRGSLSTAATDDFIHERIFWDIFASDTCALGAGFLAFPTTSIQTASFSSHGPTRMDASESASPARASGILCKPRMAIFSSSPGLRFLRRRLRERRLCCKPGRRRLLLCKSTMPF